MIVQDRDYKDLMSGYYSTTTGRQDEKLFEVVTPDRLGRCCGGFSFVAICFLLFIGMLIETQPLFINGVAPRKISNGSAASCTIQQRRTTSFLRRSLPQSLGTDQTQQSQAFGSSSSSQGGEGCGWKPKKESANAFKAAAAYFLTMVISLILMDSSWNAQFRIGGHVIALSQLRLMVTRYRKWRRKSYKEVPEFLPMTHQDTATVPGGGSSSLNGVCKRLTGRVRRSPSLRNMNGKID
eukprot:CAMPEP_0118691024 /NCGR_PEP_ID=MMETSP0800-20121206/10448_1 /TAXON_ID=210618 ORGANISM="Striatella unipunctata, Strain CCMP2910" /NCGR_SAMPLE_ID=MMETSP0800 /ASSEMBLY_ACC=CAM_ASM_000638 /LENGTH=237 /DNA_ID=CAMNT_0006588753 /DNA_START=208 /DNA_END=921 /DNA_ORIENTATION=+